MARDQWYSREEDAYLVRRARTLKLFECPHGERAALYQQLAGELSRRFGITRPWRGVQQRILELSKNL